MSLVDGVATSLGAAAITLRPAEVGPSRREMAEELARVVKALRASRAHRRRL